MGRPLRVLYVDHTSKIGGGEIALYNLVRELDPAVVKPIIVLFEEGPLYERLKPVAEVHVLPLDPRVGKASKDTLGVGSLANFKALRLSFTHVWRLARFARQHGVDLMHTNSLKADFIGGFAGRIARIPVIWHVRDRIDEDYLPKPVVRLFRFLARRVPRFVIANSVATLATVHLDGRREGAAVPSGVVLREGSGSAPSLETNLQQGKAPVIALVGRISRWKGQEIFIRAAAAVLRRYPQTRFEIIGAALFDERAYEAELHELCRELGVETSVHFIGFVEKVSARVAEIDILVHASITGEPFGQVIVEGMAEAKPVVATNGGGVPEIVQDGVTGLLVPMGDAAAMAEAIEALLADPKRAAEMGRLGRERVLERFTIEKAAALVEQIYARVLGGAHRR